MANKNLTFVPSVTKNPTLANEVALRIGKLGGLYVLNKSRSNCVALVRVKVTRLFVEELGGVALYKRNAFSLVKRVEDIK